MSIQYGKLALEGKRKLPIHVCKSGAGYYIGTWDHEGPYSRESEEYFTTREAAQKALETGQWTQRGCAKTAFTDDFINIAKLLA
jgi:hypothetical protein